MSADASVLRVDVYCNAPPEHCTLLCDVLRVQHGDFDLGEVAGGWLTRASTSRVGGRDPIATLMRADSDRTGSCRAGRGR